MENSQLAVDAGLSTSQTRRPGKATKQRRPLTRRKRRLLSALGLFGGLLMWQLAASLGVVDEAFASSPAAVMTKAVELTMSGELPTALLSSARLFIVGFAISLVLGLGFGMILGWYRYAHALFDPWVSILYSSPRIAFIPLIIVWFGVGMKTQIVIVVINALFPILINTAAGVAQVDRQFLKVSESYGASSWRTLRTVALPAAMPTLIAGIRTGMMIALLGTVVAEYFVGLTGVGGLIFNAGLRLDTDAAFVGAVVFALIGLALNEALLAVQARVDRWRS